MLRHNNKQIFISLFCFLFIIGLISPSFAVLKKSLYKNPGKHPVAKFRHQRKPVNKFRQIPVKTAKLNSVLKLQDKTVISEREKKEISLSHPEFTLSNPGLFLLKGLNPKDQNAMKRDMLILDQQFNLITKELYESKSQLKMSESQLGKLKKDQKEIIEESLDLTNKNYYLTVFLILITLVSLVVIIFLLINFLKLKKNIRKEINEKFAGAFYQNISGISPELAESFISNAEQVFSKKVKSFDALIKHDSEKFMNELKSELNDNLIKFKDNIQALLENYSYSLSEPLNQQKYLIDAEISSFSDENLLTSKIVESEINKLTGVINHKEKVIISNLEKVNLANIHFNRGNLFLGENQVEYAIEEFKKAIKTDNSFYGAYLGLGKALVINHNYHEAVNTLKNAIRKHPQYYKAYFNLANLLKNQKRYAEAVDIYQIVLKLKPENYKARYNLGITYLALSRLKEAKDQFEKTIISNKDYSDAYFSLACIEREINEEETDLLTIAQTYYKKYNASNETISLIKEAVENYVRHSEKKYILS